MALQTDLSRSPYYDDYSSGKNFYRVLYRPGTAVQTRELNQMQTILQDQIDKFGRHIFSEGSVVEGCSFTFDNSYDYVKISDTYANGFAFTISDFQDKYAYNTNGLTALIINTVVGYSSQDPDLNTIYLKYLNVGTFANGSPQTTFANNETLVVSANSQTSNTSAIVGSVSVPTVTASTGRGYAFTTTAGVIFQKGFFINVPPQTLIVSKYSNNPDNISVGFNSVENIITPEADTSLLDNAAGAPNYAAPGAHRLQLVPTLFTAITSQVENEASFFSLVDFTDGVPTSINNTAEYAALGKQLAKRTFETNGNYIVSPFLLSAEEKAETDALYQDYVNLVSSPGIGYAEGFRVEFVNNARINLRKGLDISSIDGQVVSANYGNYISVNEYVGDFDTENVTLVEIHNVSKTAITSRGFLGIGYSSGTKIGTAYIKAVEYSSGIIGNQAAIYKLYLFNINMNAGQTFSNARSLIRYSASAVKAVADIVLTYSAAIANSVASIQQPKLDTLIFPLGQQAITSNGFSSTQYVYRNKNSAQIQTTGSMAVGLPTVVGSGTESFNVSGALSTSEINNFLVIPTASVSTTNKGGTVTVISGNSTVNKGSTTTYFSDDYRSGDFIKIGTNVYQIASIANSTQLILTTNSVASATNSVHSKSFVTGVPIDFSQPHRSITVVANSSATFSLGENLASTLQTTVYHDILRKNTVSIGKSIVKNALVKIDCSSHSANSTGPWCLGLPDIAGINGIYIGTDGVYSNSTTASDSSNLFTFIGGQTDNSYDLGFIKYKNIDTSLIDNTSTILVDLNVYTHNRSQGVGFFTANSYPVNDTPTSQQRTTSIYTQEIPTYTSTSGLVYDLRDCVDYRYFAANTANPTTTVGSATVNPSSTQTFNILPSGSYLPSVNSNWQSDVKHYLPRKDLVVVTTKGRLKIIEGVSKTIPRAPNNKPGGMPLGVVTIPPYPSLTSKKAKEVNRYDYAISASITQNKRFTMAEIGALATRVDNLEYYTSLNLLEQATSSLLVKNSSTGLNRFKNGILVDPFAGHDIGDTIDPNYNIAIDPINKELRPKFNQRQEVFFIDPELSTGVVKRGDLVMLDYQEKQYIAQNYASKYRNCVEGNIYVFKGSINLFPNYSASPSLKENPDVVNNLDLSQNWINLQKAWGTQWGNWTTVSSSTTPSIGEKTETGSKTDSVGNVLKSYTQRTKTTTTTKEEALGTKLNVSGFNDTKMNLGTFVQDITIQPYINSLKVQFNCFSLKPGARVYAYFNNIAVSDWCKPTYRNFHEAAEGGLESTNSELPLNYSKYGDPLIVNSDGSIFGIFLIPPNKFQSTELQFMLCDIDNLTLGSSAISTQASATFYATNLSIAKGSSILNTRDVVVSSEEVKSERDVLSSPSITDNTTYELTPGPKVNPPGSKLPVTIGHLDDNIITVGDGWNNWDGGGYYSEGGGGDGGGAGGCGCDSDDSSCDE
jgi:hypothetical protein